LSAAAYPSQWAVSSSNLCTLHTVLCWGWLWLESPWQVGLRLERHI
jgi:hypothetical protein